MSMRRASGAPGFTLIETIVAVALSAVVMTALTSLVRYFYVNNAYVLEASKALSSARLSTGNAMADLREASYGADGSYPIQAVATSSVTFYADINSSTDIERIRYYLSGTTLFRGVTQPNGSPPSYSGQPETTTLVVDNIRNGTTSLFMYFDGSGAQLAEPMDVSMVRVVRANVYTDVNPQRAPEIYQLSASATLRNLRNTTTY